MGGCLSSSDLRGGQQAVGGVRQGSYSYDGGHNDAVDLFYRTQGFQPLFTQVEVFDFSSVLITVMNSFIAAICVLLQFFFLQFYIVILWGLV